MENVLKKIIKDYRKTGVNFQKLKKLTDLQYNLVSQDGWEQLEQVLREKEILMQEIDNDGKRMAEQRDYMVKKLGIKDASHLKTIISAEFPQLAAELSDVTTLNLKILREIKDGDDRNRTLLEEKIGKTSRQLDAVKTAKKLHRTYYRNSPSGPAHFIDFHK